MVRAESRLSPPSRPRLGAATEPEPAARPGRRRQRPPSQWAGPRAGPQRPRSTITDSSHCDVSRCHAPGSESSQLRLAEQPLPLGVSVSGSASAFKLDRDMTSGFKLPRTLVTVLDSVGLSPSQNIHCNEYRSCACLIILLATVSLQLQVEP